MSKAVEIIDGVLFVHTRHYDDVNRVIICHQKKPYRVFSDDEKKETEQTINTNQNPCINCCIKHSCKGICEKRYLWNLRKEGDE